MRWSRDRGEGGGGGGDPGAKQLDGGHEATLERRRMTSARTTVPASVSIRAYGSIVSQKARLLRTAMKQSSVRQSMGLTE
jgi:hypothetical protein